MKNIYCIAILCIGFIVPCYADPTTPEEEVNTHKPEFDYWCWIDYWDPAKQVIEFKRNVYEEALQQLAPYLFPQGSL